MKLLRFHPGETVVLNFLIPFSKYDVDAVALSFRDKDHVVLECLTTSFVEEGEKLRLGYSLTQAETLQFKEFTNYMMQLNVYGPNSSRITSKEMWVKTDSQQLTTAGYGTDSIKYNSSYNTDMDYNKLANRPSINDKTLKGNRNLAEGVISNSQIDSAVSS